MKVLIVIPAYNEKDNLLSLIEKIDNTKYDYLVINDCSIDNTEKYAELHHINVINLPINMGVSKVRYIGYKYAKDKGYDCVISIDGDGQHDPMYIERLISELKNGYDCVIGSRYVHNKKPLTIRMIGSRIISFLIYLKTRKKISDPTSGMIAFNKRATDNLSLVSDFYAEPDTICYLLNNDYKIKEVDVKMNQRQNGKSEFSNPINSFCYMISEIILLLFVR